MTVRKVGQKKKGHKPLFVPAFLLLVLWPLLVHMDEIETGLSDQAWFPDTVVQADYFMHIKSIALLFLAGWMLMILTDRNVLQKRAKVGSKYFVLPILLYFLMAVLATVFSVDHSFSLSCKTEQAETIWVIGAYLIVFWYFYDSIKYYECTERFMDYALIGAGIQSLIGISQMAGQDFWSSSLGQRLIQLGYPEIQTLQFAFSQKAQAYLSFYNPNYAAVYLVLMIPLAIYAVGYYRSRDKKVAAAVLSILLLFCLWGTKSKAGMITVVIMLAAGGIWKIKEVKKRIFFCIGTVLCIVVYAAVSFCLPGKSTLEKIIKNAFPTQASYKLHEIIPTMDEVQVFLGTQTFYLRLEQEGDRCWFSVSDKNGELQELTYDAEKGRYSFKSGRYRKISFAAYKSNELLQIVVYRKNIPYVFEKSGSDEPYRYITVYGKADDIVNAPYAFGSGYEHAFSDRVYLWGRTIPLLKKYWAIGSGPNTYALVFPQNDYVMRGNLGVDMLTQIISRPHSFYLQTAVSTGVISLVLLLIFIAGYFKRAGKCSNPILAACTLAVLGFLVMGITNDSLVVTSPVFWSVFGIGYGLTEKNGIQNV